MSSSQTGGDGMTLDPPGTIAVVGAGVLGVEAALYGRYLGYDVTLLEATAVGHFLAARGDEPLPMLPGRCLSPLAVSALRAQRGVTSATESSETLPMTYAQWVQDALIPLTQSDLLAGRLWMPARVTEIVQVPVDVEEPMEHEAIPPDFGLRLEGAADRDWIDAEAVIVSVGSSCDIRLGFEPPVPYFTRIGSSPADDPEQHLEAGTREIVAFYAQLAGRSDLDLYRPRRL